MSIAVLLDLVGSFRTLFFTIFNEKGLFWPILTRNWSQKRSVNVSNPIENYSQIKMLAYANFLKIWLWASGYLIVCVHTHSLIHRQTKSQYTLSIYIPAFGRVCAKFAKIWKKLNDEYKMDYDFFELQVKLIEKKSNSKKWKDQKQALLIVLAIWGNVKAENRPKFLFQKTSGVEL